jgi:hypothetical protein
MARSISGKHAVLFPDSLQGFLGTDAVSLPGEDCSEGHTQTISRIRNHVLRIDEHLAFQREYLASNNPEMVLAKYSHLFRG